MSEYLKSLEPNDAQCYIKKLTLTAGEPLPGPYTLVAEEWEEIINKFPDITWGNVTEYLIKTPSLYTKESVQQCFCYGVHSACKFCFIKSKVRRK